MTDEQMTTNERIAELMLEQTYAERMAMGRYLADAISDWRADGGEIDADYLCGLIEGFAESSLPAPEEQ